MAVPSTASRFRASGSALRSLDGKEVVSFHTFTLPEDQCVRLLVKNLDRGTPESVVRGELESLNIRFQRVTQLRFAHRDQEPAKDCPTTPHFIVHKDLRYRKGDHSPNSAACECQWSHTWLQKAHCSVSTVSTLDTHSVTAKQVPERSRKSFATGHPVVLKAQ